MQDESVITSQPSIPDEGLKETPARNITIEEQILYINYPDFEDTSLITTSQEIKLTGMMGSQPKCSVRNLEFEGKHEINLGKYEITPSIVCTSL